MERGVEELKIIIIKNSMRALIMNVTADNGTDYWEYWKTSGVLGLEPRKWWG